VKWIANRGACTDGQWALLQSEAWSVLLAGGYGSGKTTGLVRKLLQLEAINGKHAAGMLASQTWRSLWSITYRNLARQLIATMGREAAKPLLRVYDKQGECYLDWGREPIFLRSASDPGAIDGLDLGYVCGDEIRHWPEQSFHVSQSRARVKCPLSQRAYASTPSIGWMADEFNAQKENRQLIIAPTRENAHNLAAGYVDELYRSFSPRLAKAVVEGFFVPLEGAVFEALDPDVWSGEHVIDYDPSKHSRRKTYLWVDPGYRRSAWVWVHEVEQKAGPPTWVVFDQMMPDDMSDWSCVDAVNERGWPIDEIVVDPAADQVQSTIAIDVMDMLQRVRTRQPDAVCTIPAYMRRVSVGVERVRALLGGMHSKPRLQFARRMEATEKAAARGLLRSLLGYTYPEVSGGRARKLDEPVKDGITDHACDAVRYGCVWLWMTNPDLRELLDRVVTDQRWDRAA
jgi:hypothetical protein